MELRNYQTDLIDRATTAAVNGKRRILIQLITGGGKTIIASQMIKNCLSSGHKALFLCHRREILFQTVDKLSRFDIKSAVMLSGDPYDSTLKCVVASIATMHSWCVRRKKENIPTADLVIIDECHALSGSKTWQDIIDLYPQAIIIGLSATPISKSGKGLAAHFDEIICGPSYKSAISEKWIVKMRYFVPTLPDLNGITISQGDYAINELEDRMNRPQLIGDIWENWARLAENRPTIIFTCGVKHSICVAEQFNKMGVKAAHLDGQTSSKEREKILSSFSKGEIKIISNCAVLSEGWDSPTASCLVLARPTKSLRLYLQTCGRVLRPAPGKEDTFIIDHSGIFYQHGPIDQDWNWKLTYNKNDIEKAFNLKKERLKKEITCKECKTVFTGQLNCPTCGKMVEIKGKYVSTFEAYLQAIDELDFNKANEKLEIPARQWFSELMGYALNKGYRMGWAANKYREKFGKWPGSVWKSDRPVPPGPIVSSWIVSSIIRWKASQKYKAPVAMEFETPFI